MPVDEGKAILVRHIVPGRDRNAALKRRLAKEAFDSRAFVAAMGKRLDHHLAGAQPERPAATKCVAHGQMRGGFQIGPLPKMQSKRADLTLQQKPGMRRDEWGETPFHSVDSVQIDLRRMHPSAIVPPHEAMHAGHWRIARV